MADNAQASGPAAQSQSDAQAQMQFQARQSAVHLASQRMPQASVDDVLKEAEKIVAFMQGGGQVAAPKK